LRQVLGISACGRGGALLVALAIVSVSVPAARAEAAVVAVDRQGAATPVLWNGGVAWSDFKGVHAATEGSAPRLLLSFEAAAGLTYAYTLDGGSGAGGTSGALAYGWREANEETPPMGPGDDNVPSPPIPYETWISRRGLIGAAGAAARLTGCDDASAVYDTSYAVSLTAGAVAYDCLGVPPGAAPASTGPPSYLALSSLGALGTTVQTIANVEGSFQLSGDFIAYYTGEPFKAGKIVVENRTTNATVYQVPQSAKEDIHVLALQEDGTLVLLGEGTSTCGAANDVSEQASPAEWFSVASPVAHQLGCFYDGALRPVGGQWVALRPGPGSEASLALVDLATGSSRTLAVFPNAGMFEPRQRALEPAADFDGKRLAWLSQTCAGAAVQLTPDVGAMSPGPPLSARCPVLFHVHGALHPGARGVVRVRVSCPLGCSISSLLISGPRALYDESPTFFSLPASAVPTTRSFRLSRRQLAYLRRHRRVRITLSAEASGLGSAPNTKSATRVTLADRTAVLAPRVETARISIFLHEL
jgi:hypothetical protein